MFGNTPLSLVGRNVYLLDDDTVCKVGREGQIKQEHSMPFRVTQLPFAAPALADLKPLTPGDGEWQWCFRMSRCNVVSAKSEEDIVNIASSVFWCLGVLHKIGIVHQDVKPTNILSNPKLKGEMNYLLCDYAAAHQWRTGDGMSAAATEAFSSVPGEFQGTEKCMYRRDFESLFWSVFALWLQVLKNREAPGKFRISRRVDLSVLRDRGGSFVGDNDELYEPLNAVLSNYLVGQAKSNSLHLPSAVFQSFHEENLTSERFNLKASSNGFLPCPPEIYQWIMSHGI